MEERNYPNLTTVSEAGEERCGAYDSLDNTRTPIAFDKGGRTNYITICSFTTCPHNITMELDDTGLCRIQGKAPKDFFESLIKNTKSKTLENEVLTNFSDNGRK